MDRTERRNLARKIAKAEKKYKKADSKDKQKIENEIIQLSSQIESLDDMILIDEEIRKILLDN